MRMSYGILERYECSECEELFYVKLRNGHVFCPYCGGVETEHDGTFGGMLSERASEGSEEA